MLEPLSPRSHTSTVQWQSFEVRMRERRTQRCLLRAEIALEAGFPADARVALEEARFLDPHLPGLDELGQRIEAAGAVAPSRTPARNPRLGLAALALLVAILCTLVWLPTREEGAGATRMEAPAEDAGAAVPAAVGIRQELVTASAVEPDVPAEAPAGRRPEAARESPAPSTASLSGSARVPARVPASSTPPSIPVRPPAVTALAAPVELAPPVLASAAADDTPAPAPRATELETNHDVTPDINHEGRVRAVLSRYEAAYSGLDAAAARAVWPGVDERALARAFNGLASQRVSLEACDVAIDGGSARAECAGSATWVPKVGGGGRTENRRWSFDLRQAGGGWQIVRADAR